MCMDGDPGCVHCKGSCSREATMVVRRADMDDIAGTPMCTECGCDSLESGIFSVEDDDD